MKKYFFILICIISAHFNAFSQHKSDYVSDMMYKRILTCDDIGYNAALLVPLMYRAEKNDTLDAVVKYWVRNCGMNEPASTLSILYAIEQNTFNQQLIHAEHYNNFSDAAIADTAYFNNNIIANLYSYKYVYDTRSINDSGLDDVSLAYLDYYDLLHQMAMALVNSPRLSITEKFLTRFYADPGVTSIEELGNEQYAGTALQQAYQRTWSAQNSTNGFDYALTAGAWLPQGNLALLGGAPYFGLLLGGKRNRWTIDFNASFGIPTTSTPTYLVSNNDSLSKSNSYTAYYVAIDVAYDLLHHKKQELDLLGGIGYQGLQVLNGAGSDPTLTINSINLNLGLGYRIKLAHRVKTNHIDGSYSVHNSYIALQAKYNFLFFDNAPGTSLSGNVVTVGIVYGGLFKNYKY